MWAAHTVTCMCMYNHTLDWVYNTWLVHYTEVTSLVRTYTHMALYNMEHWKDSNKQTNETKTANWFGLINNTHPGFTIAWNSLSPVNNETRKESCKIR